MQLRSRYVMPSNLKWEFDSDDENGEEGSCYQRTQQQERSTNVKAPAVVSARPREGPHQSQSRVPAPREASPWVPTRFLSYVPDPRYDGASDLQVATSQDNLPNHNSDIEDYSHGAPNGLPTMHCNALHLTNGPRSSIKVQFEGFIESNLKCDEDTIEGMQLPFSPLLGDDFQPVENGLPSAFQSLDITALAGSHLPLLPLDAGCNPFFDLSLQPALSLNAPDFKSVLAMDTSPFPNPANDVLNVSSGSVNAVDNTSASSNVNANPNNVPLLCHLCPRRPKFSDVSHLLTHISSKSHLANLFQLGLSDDDADKQTIRRFNEWEEQYGINQLLKNRQDAKEQKKQGQNKRQRAAGTEKKARRASAARGGVKIEPEDAIRIRIDPNPLNQNAWHLHTPRDTSFDDIYQTPSMTRARSVYPQPDSPQAQHFLNEPALDGRDAKTNTPRLKGAVWPGMNIFDAATPDMQRMRNQKKHSSVLQNMIMTSESIEQDELIWDDKMVEITRTRNVYDSPSVDGSFDSKDDDEDPPAKKRRVRRAAHAEPSIQRQPRARSAKTSGRRKPGKKVLKIEEESDLEDGVKQRFSRGRRGLDVFDDSTEDISLGGGDVFGGRRQSAQALNGSSFEVQDTNLAFRNAMQGLSSNRPMASMFGRSNFQPSFAMLDKENDRSAFSMQQPNGLPSFYNQLRQNVQTGDINPLCVQTQNPFPYLYGDGFDHNKPSAPNSFSSMNGMNYHGLHSGMTTSMHENMNGVSHFQSGNNTAQSTSFDA